MKAVKIFSTLYFLSALTLANSHDRKPGNHQSITQQLATLLTYPDQLKKPVRGIVIIQFRIDEYSRICQVKVHSRNDILNFHFIRAMTGQKLHLAGPVASDLYTIRVHMSLPEQDASLQQIIL